MPIPPFDPTWDITVEDAKAKLDAGETALLLDVRTPGEHATCTIDDGVLLPVQEIMQRVDELEPFKDQPVIVYCHLGGRSRQATQYLRQQGFTNVMNMFGGIDQWAVDIEPSMPRY